MVISTLGGANYYEASSSSSTGTAASLAAVLSDLLLTGWASVGSSTLEKILSRLTMTLSTTKYLKKELLKHMVHSLYKKSLRHFMEE